MPETGWGAGGKSPLLCFDGSFGSSHGIVFAGSGGFKTTSVTIPTALKWGGTLIVLDPSNEVAPMVKEHAARRGRDVIVLDPKDPDIGFNARLDWSAWRHERRGYRRGRVVDHEREWPRQRRSGRFLSGIRLTVVDGDHRRCLPLRSYGKEGSDAAAPCA
jgi:hypothetical protein